MRRANRASRHCTSLCAGRHQVPEGVQRANAVALAALWRDAQELASESLRAARTGWDAERSDADTLSKRMADAYEAQETEMAAAQAVIRQLKIDTGHAATDKARLDGALGDTRCELALAKAATERFEARAIEVERRRCRS